MPRVGKTYDRRIEGRHQLPSWKARCHAARQSRTHMGMNRVLFCLWCYHRIAPMLRQRHTHTEGFARKMSYLINWFRIYFPCVVCPPVSYRPWRWSPSRYRNGLCKYLTEKKQDELLPVSGEWFTLLRSGFGVVGGGGDVISHAFGF